MTEETNVSPDEIAQETSTEESSTAFNFADYFPEDVKSDPDFERISSNLPLDKPEMLAKELYHKTKHFGKVKDEVRKELEGEFNKEYAPEDYSYEAPENYEPNEEILGAIKSKAQELGINPDSFKALAEEYMGLEQGVMTKSQEESEAQFQAQIKEESDFLKQKNGLESEKLIEQSKTTWNNFVDPRYKDIFDNFDKGTQLVLADMLNNISNRVSEPSTGKQESSYTMSRDTALSKIAEIRADSNIPEHQKTSMLSELYPVAYQDQDAKSLGIVSNLSKL